VIRRRVRRILLAIAVVAGLLWWLCPSSRPHDPIVAAVGDMACASADPRYGAGNGLDGWCQQAAVSDLAVEAHPDALLGLGDYQYEEARGADYASVYGPTWGRLRAMTRPALGNQEYKVHDANTFTSYFAKRAPAPTSGWYSYNIGTWHVVVLNSNCAQAGGCDAGSPQMTWLDKDLATNQRACTIAYWHHPRWSTGLYGSDSRMADMWRTVAAHHVDVVLAAHEHDYERFEPLDADGSPSATGVTSFVVGTGGQATYGPDDAVGGGDLAGVRRLESEGSAIRIDDHSGVLLLTLAKSSFEWRFVGVGGTVLDQGHQECVQ
jgi:acid phosphatase type 7